MLLHVILASWMPTSTASVVELWVILDNVPELALSIPLDKCLALSVNPLKWLRFLGYSIYGRQGYLAMSATGPPIGDYTVHIAACPYYFISEDDPLFADVDAINDRTSSSSVLSDRREDFRDRIVGRDGTCVCTGEIPLLCVARHILPHSKGDNYIANVIGYRDNSDELDGINDIRNGLLLSIAMHILFGNGSLAFLKTPNLYLLVSVDDIPRNLRGGEHPTMPRNRITVHYIVDSRIGILLPRIVPNNHDVREPANTSEWPPATIINSSYTSAVLQAWASESFQQTMRTMVKEFHYNSDGLDDEQGDVLGLSQERLKKRNAKKALQGVMAFRMRSARRDGSKGNRQRNTNSDLPNQESQDRWLHSQGVPTSSDSERAVNEKKS